ncbi:hypothetical protein [Nocardioides ganghwensis]|uniref:Uncharacterized protein n=1 Tax=Nocardioides ganghwensis TaxID=252230 RepID=A0A4Q2S8X8_9ACTN|nr:hypothetical protein [Nocardioides ganghwensis]MBD3945620.1 hypothetical protein [Nocardioides ganghwensis]RYB99653.1 hypothetical protein EUA07_16025 [Nocardioides ganghwensis]
MQDVSEDFRTMLAALRVAVATPADADRPGRLRQRLDEALGPDDSVRLRRLAHQVVAASEENLPHDLRRITPLTAQSLQRLSQDLAAARGWTPEAAQRTTQLWASALGFGDLASASWPRDGSPTRPQGSAPVATPLPLSATLLPEARPAARPAAARRPGPPPGPGPRPHEAAPAWPPLPKNLARHTANLAGEPALGVTLAYAGMSLPLCLALGVALTVVLCLPILFIGPAGGMLSIVAIGGGKLLVAGLRRGALVASANGLEFTPYDTSLRKPKPDQSFGAVWSQVAVEQGRVSVLRLAGRRVQVGPRNRAFVAAAAARAGSRR